MRTFIYAFIFSSLSSAAGGAIIVPLLRKFKLGQNILGYVKEHNYKSGTPTMGGVIFVFSAIISFFMLSCGNKSLAVVSAAIGGAYMIVGFIDDFIKIKLGRNEGLNPLQKTIFEMIIAVIVSVYCYKKGLTRMYIPFGGETIDFGGFFIPICIFAFLATTNSVNLTDGLDGLAGGVSYIYFLALAILIYAETKMFSANYVNVREYENLSLLCVSLSGGIVGFLLFNTYKASVFMGDTGSLSIGGFIASVSIFSGNSFFIPIMGITFVLSSISVIMQVIYFKTTGKRVFLMAPLHHHFQHMGYSESKIVFAYKFVTLLFSLVSILAYV